MKYPKYLGSSTNPEELSLTIKGVLLSLVPILVVILGSFGVSVVQTDLVEFINAIFAVVSACIIAYGLGRKLVKK